MRSPGTMDISVIIPTHNQKDRLRLVLCGLECQTFARQRFEVVVVDDGCTDGTADMVREVIQKGLLNTRLLGDGMNGGRNAARNRGLAQADGDLAIFLDGDALPAPDHLEQYWLAHKSLGPAAVLCGHQLSLPDVEYFQDPQTDSLAKGIPIASVLKDFLSVRREEFAITEEMIRNDFDAIREQAQEGGYPLEGSRRRHEQVGELLQERPQASVAWLALIPHNCAVPRALIEAAGGFDEEITFHEGWKLAYRLQRYEGASIHKVEAATYHLYHYHPFSEMEASKGERRIRQQAIEYMATKHNDSRIQLLHFWLGYLSPDPFVPEEALIKDLIEFDRRYQELPEDQWHEYELILGNHPSEFPVATVEER